MRSRKDDTLALIRLLAYGQWNVEAGREVVRHLVAQGREAVPFLSRALADPSTPRVSRLAIAWILGSIGGAEADRAGEAGERDRDADLASTAAAARGRCVRPGRGVLAPTAA